MHSVDDKLPLENVRKNLNVTTTEQLFLAV